MKIILTEEQIKRITPNFIFDEGKKYFKNLKIKDERYFLNYPKNKGSFSLNGFISHLTLHKLRIIINEVKPGNIYYSKTTDSVYFTLDGENIRLSDHGGSNFDGLNFKVTWKTNPYDVIVLLDKIKNGEDWEYMKSHYYE